MSLHALSLRHYSSETIQMMTIANVLWIMMALALLTYVLHNCFKYLVRQGRYKEFHITFFYLLAFATLAIRIIQFTMTVAYYHGAGRHVMTRQISALVVASSFLEGTLGLQQLCAMVDVQLMIKYHQTGSNESLERFEIKN